MEKGISTVSIDEINIEWVDHDEGAEEEEEGANFVEMAELVSSPVSR